MKEPGVEEVWGAAARLKSVGSEGQDVRGEAGRQESALVCRKIRGGGSGGRCVGCGGTGVC